MNDMTKIEVPVEKATALALSDDPLVALFERTSNDARSLGLSDEEIEAELDAYNAERRV